jgi:hypothetical protein
LLPGRPCLRFDDLDLSPWRQNLHSGDRDLSPRRQYPHDGDQDLSPHPNEQSPLVGNLESLASWDQAYRWKLSVALSSLTSRFLINWRHGCRSLAHWAKRKATANSGRGSLQGKAWRRKNESSSSANPLCSNEPRKIL